MVTVILGAAPGYLHVVCLLTNPARSAVTGAR
jgi:hypothetical protein